MILAGALHCAAFAGTRIGVLLPSDATEATSMRRGIEVAAELARARGTEVEVLFSGAHGQWGTEGDEAARLVLDEKVTALIAPRDRAITHLALQVSGRTRTPVATLCPDSSVTGTGVPWCARVLPSTVDEAVAVMTWAKTNGVHGTRWMAVVPAGRAGREVFADLQRAAAIDHVELTRATSVVAEGSTADAVLLWLDPAAAAATVREFAAVKSRVVLAGPSTLNTPRFLSDAGNAAAGVVIATTCGGLTPDFTSNYVQRFKSAPDTIAIAAADAALLLIDRCQNKSWPACGDRHRGVSGELKFDVNGNRLVTLDIRQCIDGHFIAPTPRKP